MIVSSAMAVLPVCRSPMISSRCPRPIGIMASMAFDAGLQRLFAPAGGRRRPGARRSSGLNCVGSNRPFAVQRMAERIDNAADQRLAHRHRHDAPVRRTSSPSFIRVVVAEQHCADLVFFQVQSNPDAVRELDQLARHDQLQAVDPGDAVAHRDHR
jgi:hypothetical protein